MKFYYSPGACSAGIHFLLEEVSAEYEAVPIPVKEGRQFSPEYVKVNPKSKVPVLERPDGSILTEFGAIARWIGATLGDGALKPENLEEEVRIIETLDFVVGTIHMHGFSRILKPSKYARSEADHDWVREQGRAIVTNGFDVLSDRLGDQPFILGDKMTIADAAMFYTLFWGIDRLQMELPDNIHDYYRRISTRPAALEVFRQEGTKAI
jgi:glutathione S-transferase